MGAQLKVEKDGEWGKDANKEFQLMERSTGLRLMLTSILALGLYCTRMLLRPIQEQKELATIPLPTDATVQSLAMASKETNGDLMKRLQRDVAGMSEGIFLDPASYYDGICKVRGLGLRLINKKTGQDLSSKAWSWDTDALTGQKTLKLGDEAQKLADEGALIYDCDKMALMLTAGDLQTPLILPNLPASSQENRDLIRALRRELHFIGKKDGEYGVIKRSELDRLVGPRASRAMKAARDVAVKGAIDDSRPYGQDEMDEEVEFSD